MAQIPREKIDEIRSRLDIVEVVGRSVDLNRKGQRYWGRCPFHQEKTPSFSVSRDRQLYHCFGCGAGGNVFDFVMRLEGVDFPEVVRNFAKSLGIELPESGGSRGPAPDYRDRLFELNELAARFYEEALTHEERALRYLEDQRGLTAETIRRFRLGWAPEGWSALLEHVQKHRVDVKLGLEIGLFGQRARDGKPYDRLRARIVFPIAVPRLGIAGFGARRADWIDPEGPKYLNSPESPIYDKSSILYGLSEARDDIRKMRQTLMVEGYLDVIALVQEGFTNTVAACGTALTDRHATMLSRLGQEVVTIYDGDPAGEEATRKTALILLAHGIQVRCVALPGGEDPDTYVRKEGQDALKKQIDEAPSAIDFFLAKARRLHQGGGVAGMTGAVESIRPMILAISDPLTRDVAIEATAKQLGLGSAVLRKHLGKEALPAPKKVPNVDARGPRPKEAPAKVPIVEIELLRSILDRPADVVPELESKDALGAFTSDGIRAAVAQGIESFAASTRFDAPQALEAAAAAGMGEAELSKLREILMERLPEEHSVAECVTRLLRERKKAVLRELRKRIEEESDPERQAELAAEVSRLMSSDP